MANIIIDYQGREGVKLIRGLPNYQGSWSGSYIRVSCSDSGDPGMSCSSFSPPIGTVSLTKLDIVQDHDRVSGNFTTNQSGPFPSYVDAVGKIQIDGELLLTGIITTGPFTIQTSWTMVSTIPGQITGSLVEIYSKTGTAVYVQFTGNIRDLSRTSNARIGTSAPRVSNPTLQSLICIKTRQGAFK